MNAFRLSPEASQDIIEIYEYIAQDSTEAAERVRVELLEAMRGLAEMPGKGHRREDLTKGPVLFCSGLCGHIRLFTAREANHSI